MADQATQPTHGEAGEYNEKAGTPGAGPTPYQKPAKGEEEDEDEDLDALIEELESQDGHQEEEEEEENAPPGCKQTLLPLPLECGYQAASRSC